MIRTAAALFVVGALAGACAGSRRVEPGGWRAGTARVKITPEQPFWLLAWDLHRPAQGVEEDLWARALAIEDSAGARGVWVTADVLGFPPSMALSIRRKARRRFGLGEGQLLLVATHTHNGPVLPERPSLEIYHALTPKEAEPVFAYARELERRVMDLIGEAIGRMEPARLGFGRGRSTFGANRRLKYNPNGPTDPDVPVLEVRSTDGRRRAVLFGYACHGTTVMADSCFDYFGDYPGEAALEIERRSEPTVALFATGCGGDINPAPRGNVELARRHGRTLADEVLSVLGTPGRVRALDGPLRVAFRRIELPLEPPPERALLEKLRGHPTPAMRRLADQTLRQMGEEGGVPRAVPYPLAVWRFGSDLAIVALSGEVCVDYALRLKRELGPERTWPVGYAHEVACYIPSERVLAEGGYEAGWSSEFGRAVATPSMAIYGWPVPLAPGVEDRIVGAVHAMMK
jgi:hypothetical protein